MGLDFSHCDAHWSFSGFHSFRCRVAQVLLNINLEEMKGFGKIGKIWEDWAITTLLNHSDCDGEITPEDLKKVIPELEKFISLEGRKDQLYYDYDIEQCKILIKGMKLAIKKKENLKFI